MLSGVTLPLPTPPDFILAFFFNYRGKCKIICCLIFCPTELEHSPHILCFVCSELLEENCLHDNHKKLSLVNHPALLGHTWDFLKQVNLNKCLDYIASQVVHGIYRQKMIILLLARYIVHTANECNR